MLPDAPVCPLEPAAAPVHRPQHVQLWMAVISLQFAVHSLSATTSKSVSSCSDGWWTLNGSDDSRRMAVSFLTVPLTTRSRTSSMESWDPTRGSSSRKRFLLPTQQAQSEIWWFHCSVNWDESLLRCDTVLMGTVVVDILDSLTAFICRVKQTN